MIWICDGLHAERVHPKFKEGLPMKTFGTQWERVRIGLTPAQLRVGLALVSLVAMVFAGAAGEHWT
jgi:hypothetical protein